MTLFFIIAALLVGLCLLWLLLGLFRSRDSATDQEAVNITLARERRATLAEALANGSIDQASHDYEREQLEYDLAADLRMEHQSKPHRDGHVAAAIIVAVFVPVAAGALYLQLGNPQAISQQSHQPPAATTATTATADNEQAPSLVELLPRLEARLATAPDDVNGWRLLGRSYLSVNDFAKARSAFEKALALDQSDVATLAQLAESIAMTREGDLSGEAMKYLERANTLDPDHEQALWLLAIARQQTGDHPRALQGFERLAALSADNPEALAAIEQMRARSLETMADGKSASSNTLQDPVSGTQSDSVPAKEASNSQAASSSASIQVSVSLSAAARSAVTDGDAVFIYARASEGPPMPLAVSRVTVSDLPATITLDDSMAMIPNMTLSAFPSVSIGARVSKSGNPLAQSGDWFAEKYDIPATGTDSISLTIDRQSP